jgi:REP element-mobilizing transposase RayT
MSQVVHKSHNVSILLYHFVYPTKYRRSIISETIERELIKIYQEVEEAYEIDFLEIGADRDHIHFLIQSVSDYRPAKIIRTVKSITTRELRSRITSLTKIFFDQVVSLSRPLVVIRPKTGYSPEGVVEMGEKKHVLSQNRNFQQHLRENSHCFCVCFTTYCIGVTVCIMNADTAVGLSHEVVVIVFYLKVVDRIPVASVVSKENAGLVELQIVRDLSASPVYLSIHGISK